MLHIPFQIMAFDKKAIYHCHKSSFSISKFFSLSLSLPQYLPAHTNRRQFCALMRCYQLQLGGCYTSR